MIHPFVFIFKIVKLLNDFCHGCNDEVQMKVVILLVSVKMMPLILKQDIPCVLYGEHIEHGRSTDLSQDKRAPISHQRALTYLFIELVDDALCPLQMQLLALQRPIDVGQFDTHLTHQQPVILVGPVDTSGRVIAHLWESTSRYNMSADGAACIHCVNVIPLISCSKIEIFHILIC